MTYPQELLEKMDNDTLREWRGRIDDMMERLEEERAKITDELERRK